MAAEEDLSIFAVLVLTVVFGALGVAIFLVFRPKPTEENEEISEEIEKSVAAPEKPKTESKPAAVTKKKNAGGGKDTVSHPLLLANLKGHTGNVLGLDFSSNGKHLASCSEDRTARLWNVKDFSDREHKYVRANVEFDHSTSIAISPDTKAFVVSLSLEQTVRVFKINKKKDGGTAAVTISHEYDFPKHHKVDIISVGISSAGTYVMTASKDTTLIIWNLKGEVYEKLDTLLMYNSCAKISPCGNLVAASGFTADVKMWHVGFKNGEFQKVSRALELKGHSAGVYSFSFTTDSKRVATVSKDGSWKVWDIDVDYMKGQGSYLLKTGSFTPPPEGVSVHIALTPDTFTVALSVGRSISLYNTNTCECEEELDDVHPGNISSLIWYSDSRQLVSSGGRSIHVWHNPVGARASLGDLKNKLLKAKNDSMKERIEAQIKETKAYLSKF